jgi:hypothetical protein
MANKQLFLNNINVTLALPISDVGATEIYLAAGLGNNLPNPAAR